MSQGWTYDATSPITDAYVGCNLGNNTASSYCDTYDFNQTGIPIGAGQRLVPGKYTLYISAKDAVAGHQHGRRFNCIPTAAASCSRSPLPLTNAWPTTAAGVITASVNLTTVTGGATCYLGVRFFGATTADQIQIGYFAFAPVAEQFNAQTINVTNLNGPGGVTGCAQSPVTGINNGYTCPTKGWGTTLTANQTSSQTTIALTSTAGLSPAGCFFVDGEYECYTGISGSTLTGISRGAYTTTAATHNSGATAVGVSLVLGSPLNAPFEVVAYGGVFAIRPRDQQRFPLQPWRGQRAVDQSMGGMRPGSILAGGVAPAEWLGAELLPGQHRGGRQPMRSTRPSCRPATCCNRPDQTPTITR